MLKVAPFILVGELRVGCVFCSSASWAGGSRGHPRHDWNVLRPKILALSLG